MTAFAGALAVIFRDPNMAVDALHRAGGQPFGGEPCRVIRKNPDQGVEFNGSRFVAGSDLLDVQVSQVPALELGDHFVIGAEVLEVIAEPVRDRDRLLWTVPVRTFVGNAI